MRRIANSCAVLACLISVPLGTAHLEAALSTSIPLVAPRFEIELLRSRLMLDGHTLSASHERQLQDAAIAETRSSTAVLTESSLTIRAMAAA